MQSMELRKRSQRAFWWRHSGGGRGCWGPFRLEAVPCKDFCDDTFPAAFSILKNYEKRLAHLLSFGFVYFYSSAQQLEGNFKQGQVRCLSFAQMLKSFQPESWWSSSDHLHLSVACMLTSRERCQQCFSHYLGGSESWGWAILHHPHSCFWLEQMNSSDKSQSFQRLQSHNFKIDFLRKYFKWAFDISLKILGIFSSNFNSA